VLPGLLAAALLVQLLEAAEAAALEVAPAAL